MNPFQIKFVVSTLLLLNIAANPEHVSADRTSKPAVLKGAQGVEAVFEEQDSYYRWAAYQDIASGNRWDISGPLLSFQTADGTVGSIGGAGFTKLTQQDSQVVLEADLSNPPIRIKQTFSFCADGRTLRIQTSLRASDKPIFIQRIRLLEITVRGEKLRLTGPEFVSCPIFGEDIFAGIEHPSAHCHVDGSSLSLEQPIHKSIGQEWVDLPPAVFGSASEADSSVAGNEALRYAFIRYLNTVRVKPQDMHVHYNDWWTAPVPSSSDFVFNNIAELRKGLYDPYNFFFDSYALDAGWSDVNSVWEIDKRHFPDGFNKIRDVLSEIGSRPGLWVSPSSLYPFTLDNQWLKSAGYEVTPHERLGLNACLALGGKYQSAFKAAVLKHTRSANLGHIKFDGFVPSCNVESHAHPPGADSYLPITEGLMDVFDAVRSIDPNIALEPTCFGYNPSPWWLMHVPFIIGPFGDDSPKGRCPCPEWIEAMTTVRDIKNLEGRDSFLMPSSALQCFDIIVQCPGAFQNHAAMAIGRGRWFISCYINPKFMEAEEWRFFAELMTWARQNRNFLQEPMPIGGDPAKRQAYGYAFQDESRGIFCLRNPWIEKASIPLPSSRLLNSKREVRTLYPRRQKIAALNAGEPLPAIQLGPYETLFVEVVTSDTNSKTEQSGNTLNTKPSVRWNPTYAPVVKHLKFQNDPQPFGPSWSCPDGEAVEILQLELNGELEIKGARTTELHVLCTGESIEAAFPRFEMTIDGINCPVEISRSVGSFSAGGHTNEEWVWFMTPVPEGVHSLALFMRAPANSANIGVYLRGTESAPESLPPFEAGPSFPLYQPELIPWSYTLVPLAGSETELPLSNTVPRTIEKIEGVYLDTLKWIEATTGWGEIHLNRSIKGETMTMGGRAFRRGIGTHAHSRIVYQRPQDCNTFAATIGCDQKALVGSIVFVVEGDGKELFRSPVLRAKSEPMDIEVPIDGTQKITLIVEDGGDRIAADHGNWADARFLR